MRSEYHARSESLRSWRRSQSLVALSAVLSCLAGCSDPAPVPEVEPREEQPEDSAEEVETLVREHAPETREISTEGGTTVRAESIVASVRRGDVLLAVASTENRVGILARAGDGEQRWLTEATLDECSLASGAVEQADGISDRAIASANLDCGEEGQVRYLWPLRLGAGLPRVLESIALRGEVGGDFGFVAVDDDEHPDLRGTLSLANTVMTLEWLDRAGGLARADEEPARTLARAREAGQSLAPIVRAFCRRAEGDAMVRLGAGRWGLECPEDALPAEGVRQAIEFAESGPLDEAVLALSDSADPRVLAAVIARARVVSVRRVGEVNLSASSLDSGLHFEGAALRFNGDSTGEVSHPVASSGSSQRVMEVVSACGGPEAHILDQGVELRVRLATQEGCERELRHPWVLLGWAPQGLVSARGGQRMVAPLSAELRPAGPPRELGRQTPAPAPLRGARSDVTGETWVYETPVGVLRFANESVQLLRSENWDALGTSPSSAALSSSGEVAFVRGNAVYLFEL